MNTSEMDVILSDTELNVSKRALIRAIFDLIKITSNANIEHEKQKEMIAEMLIIEKLSKNETFKNALIETDNLINNPRIDIVDKNKNIDARLRYQVQNATNVVLINKSEIFSINDLQGKIDFTKSEFSGLQKSLPEPTDIKNAYIRYKNKWILLNELLKEKIHRFAKDNTDEEKTLTNISVLNKIFDEIKKSNKMVLNKVQDGDLASKIPKGFRSTPKRSIIPESAQIDKKGLVQIKGQTKSNKPNLIITPKILDDYLTTLKSWGVENAKPNKKYIAGPDKPTNKMTWVVDNSDNVAEDYDKRTSSFVKNSYFQYACTEATKVNKSDDQKAITPKCLNKEYLEKNRGLKLPKLIKNKYYIFHAKTSKTGEFEDIQQVASSLKKYAKNPTTQNDDDVLQSSDVFTEMNKDTFADIGDKNKDYFLNSEKKIIEKKDYPLSPLASNSTEGYISGRGYTTFKKIINFLKKYSKYGMFQAKNLATRTKAYVAKTENNLKLIDKKTYKNSAVALNEYDGFSTKESIVISNIPVKSTSNSKDYYQIAKYNDIVANTSEDIKIEFYGKTAQSLTKKPLIAVSDDEVVAAATEIKSNSDDDILYIKNLNKRNLVNNIGVKDRLLWKIPKEDSTKSVFNYEISPSGLYVLVSRETQVYLYSIKTKYLVFRLKVTGITHLGKTISFSTDEKHIVLTTDKSKAIIISTVDYSYYSIDIHGIDNCKFIPNRKQFITTVPSTGGIFIYTYLDKSKKYEMTQYMKKESNKNNMNIAISRCGSYLSCGADVLENIYIYQLQKGNKPIVKEPIKRISNQKSTHNKNIKYHVLFLDKKAELIVAKIETKTTALEFTLSKYTKELNTFVKTKDYKAETKSIGDEIIENSITGEFLYKKKLDKFNFEQNLTAKINSGEVEIYTNRNETEFNLISEIAKRKKDIAGEVEISNDGQYVLLGATINSKTSQILLERTQHINKNKEQTTYTKVGTFIDTEAGVIALNKNKIAVKFKTQGFFTIFSAIDNLSNYAIKSVTLTRNNAFSEVNIEDNVKKNFKDNKTTTSLDKSTTIKKSQDSKTLTLSGAITRTISLSNDTFSDEIAVDKTGKTILIVLGSEKRLVIIKGAESDKIQYTHITNVDKVSISPDSNTFIVTTDKEVIFYDLLPLSDVQIPTCRKTTDSSIDYKKIAIANDNTVALYTITKAKTISKSEITAEFDSKTKTVKITTGKNFLAKNGIYATIATYTKYKNSYVNNFARSHKVSKVSDEFLKISQDGNFLQYSVEGNKIITANLITNETMPEIAVKSSIKDIHKKVSSSRNLQKTYFIENDLTIVEANSETGKTALLSSYALDPNSSLSCSFNGRYVALSSPKANKITIHDVLEGSEKEVSTTLLDSTSWIYFSEYDYLINKTSNGVMLFKNKESNIKHYTTVNYPTSNYRIKEFLTKPSKYYAYLYSLDSASKVEDGDSFTYQDFDNITVSEDVQIAGVNVKPIFIYEQEENKTPPTTAGTNLLFEYTNKVVTEIKEKFREILAKIKHSSDTTFKTKGNKAVITSETEHGNLGYSTAMDKDYFVLGNPSKGEIVYYVKNVNPSTKEVTWSKKQNISGGDSFGASVSSSGKKIIVGEPKNSKATIYKKDNNNNFNKENDLTGSNDFGQSVAISDNFYDFIKNQTGWFTTKKTTWAGLPNNAQGYTGYNIKDGQTQLVKLTGTNDIYTKYKGGAWVKNGAWGGVLWYLGSKIGFEKAGDNQWHLKGIAKQFTPKVTHTGLSLSSDGSRIVVGAYDDNYAEVYDYKNGSWSLVGKRITGWGKFGWSTAISSDGSRIIVGAINGGHAAVYDYKNGSWSLVGNSITGSVGFGCSTAMSSDGSRIVVGAPDSRYAEVYDYKNGSWGIVGNRITGSGYFGFSAAMSSDGSRIVVGTSDVNYAEVYDYKNGSWSLVGKRITGSGKFGWSTAMSSDGSRIVFGAPDSSYAEVYDYKNGSWGIVGNRITGPENFGWSTAMSSDGSRIVFGSGFSFDVYEYSKGSWGLAKHITDSIKLGDSNAISGDGDTVTGGDGDKGGTSVYQFYPTNHLYLNTPDGKHYFSKKELKDDTNFDSIMETVAPLSSIPDPIVELNRNLKLTPTDIQEQPNKTGAYVSLKGTGTATTPTNIGTSILVSEPASRKVEVYGSSTTPTKTLKGGASFGKLLDANDTYQIIAEPDSNAITVIEDAKTEKIATKVDSLSLHITNLLVASKTDNKVYIYDLTKDPIVKTKTISIPSGYGDSCTLGKTHFTVGSKEDAEVKVFDFNGKEIALIEGQENFGSNQSGHDDYLLIGSETANYAEVNNIKKESNVDYN